MKELSFCFRLLAKRKSEAVNALGQQLATAACLRRQHLSREGVAPHQHDPYPDVSACGSTNFLLYEEQSATHAI